MLRIAGAWLAFLILFSSADAQQPAPADSRLNSIITNKAIRIAYRTSARPFSFTNERQEPSGYTVDLCRMVVKSMAQQFALPEIRIDWVPVDVTNRFTTIVDNKADIECGSSTVTLSRMTEVDFSIFVFVETTGVVVARAANLRSFDDLAGKRIAVVAGTTNERVIIDQVRTRNMKANIIPVKEGEGMPALEAGRVDAYASDKLLLIGSRIDRPEAMVLLPDDLSVEPYAIALPRGDWALRLAVNRGLSQVFRSGAGLENLRIWFGQIGLRPGPLLTAVFAFGGLAD